MFKRRTPRSLSTIFTNILWPKIGWRRTLVYYWQRLIRIPGSPESIAAGFACGAAASMMPLVGFHFLLSVLLALMMRGSVLASMFGTVVGNPWTFPFIWLGTYEFGGWLLGQSLGNQARPPFFAMFTDLFNAMISADAELFIANVWPLWWPMMVGSLPVAIIVGCFTYALLVKPIRRFRKFRSRAQVLSRHE